LPSISTTTPPAALVIKIGIVAPTPALTAEVRRFWISTDFGPGIAVTSLRSWARPLTVIEEESDAVMFAMLDLRLIPDKPVLPKSLRGQADFGDYINKA
jgi:hypothetical protein